MRNVASKFNVVAVTLKTKQARDMATLAARQKEEADSLAGKTDSDEDIETEESASSCTSNDKRQSGAELLSAHLVGNNRKHLTRSPSAA